MKGLLAFLAFLAVAAPAEARMHAPYKAHRIMPAGAALDAFTQPAAAYSFRKLRTAYTGNAAKLRRTTGGTQDIGFTATGDFDTAAATAFCAATTCFIDTWYDQSTNARHLTQATPASQPALIFNCTGTLPCARTTAAQVLLSSSAALIAAGKGSFSVVGNRQAGTGNCYWMLSNGINGFKAVGTSANLWALEDSVTNIPPAASDAAWHAGIGVINGASSLVRIDQTETTGNIAGNAAAGQIYVNFGSASTTCSLTEAVYWDGYYLTVAERAALVANQQQYWMPLPLDSFTAPAAAYGMRKLKSTYAGPAIRLRRASDNAESDINFLGFVPGLGSPLDVAAANAHCAATSCYLAKWYDQSGNARDLVQATPANQPALIFSCQNSLPCLRVTAAAQLLGTVATFTPAAVMSFSAVARRSAGTGVVTLLQTANSNKLYIDPSTAWVMRASADIAAASVEGSLNAAVAAVNGAASVLRMNASEVTGNHTALTIAAPIYAALGAATTTVDEIEVIVWDAYALTAPERAALVNNQRSFWGF